MFKSSKQITLLLPIQRLPGCYGSRYEDFYFNSSPLHSASFQKAHTQAARSASERGDSSFSVLNMTALVMHQTAAKFQLLPTYSASRHTTYKTNL